MARFEDNTELNVPCYHANAILRNGISQTYDEHTFLLPTAIPEDGPDQYSVRIDEVTGIIHVASRYRHVSLKELLEIRDPNSPKYLTCLAEFSNGKITAVPRRSIARSYAQGTANIKLKPQHADASGSSSRLTKQTFASGMAIVNPDINIVSLLKDAIVATSQEEVSGEATPTTSSPHDHTTSILDTPATSISPSAASPLSIETESTKSVSTQASPLSPCGDKILPGVDRWYDLRHQRLDTRDDSFLTSESRRENHYPLDDLVTNSEQHDLPVPAFDASTVQYRTPKQPSPHGALRIDEDGIIREVLHEIQKSPVQPSHGTDALNHLDNVKESFTIRSQAIHSEESSMNDAQSSQSSFETEADVGVELPPHTTCYDNVFHNEDTFANSEDGFIGELLPDDQSIGRAPEEGFVIEENTQYSYGEEAIIPALASDSSGQSSRNNLDISAVFGDDEGEYNPLLATPTANEPQQSAPPTDLTPLDATINSPIEFGTEVSVDLMRQLNTEYNQVWDRGIAHRTCLPWVDELRVLEIAVSNLRNGSNQIPDYIIGIIQQFNKAYARLSAEEIWPVYSCLSHEQYAAHLEELAASCVKWQYFFLELYEHRPPLQPRKRLDRAPSASTWIIEAFGGSPFFWNDTRFRDHQNHNENIPDRTASLIGDEKVDVSEHHINFQRQWFHEKSNTPSSVSLFAAVTASRQEPIRDRVCCKAVTKSQAAKRIDPFEFDGDLDLFNEQIIDSDGHAEWKWKGTALRDLATGRASIVYESHGSWDSDTYDSDEDIPMLANGRYEDSATLDFSGRHSKYKGLQWPYFMRSDEDRDIIVNDDGKGRPFPSRKQKEKKEWKDTKNCGPSPLRLVTDQAGIESWIEPQASKHDEYSTKKEESDGDSSRVQIKADAEEASTVDYAEAEARELCDVYEQITPQSATDNEDASGSEAETDIQSNADLEREPVDYVESSLDLFDTDDVPAEEGNEVYIQSDQPPSSPDEFDIEAMYKHGRDRIAGLTASHRMLRPNVDEHDGDDGSDVESDQESFDGANGMTDHASIWTKQAALFEHPKADILLKFSEANTSQRSKHRPERQSSEDLEQKVSDIDEESCQIARHASGKQALHSLEDGRYISPSKMALSRIDEVHTPIQSPSKEQDYGSWEVNESGVHETPRRNLAFQADDETGAKKFCNAAKRRSVLREHSSEKTFVVGAVFNPLSRSRIPIPTNRQPAGNSQDDEDVFASRPAQSSIQTRANATPMTFPQSASSTGSMLEIQRVRRSRPFKPSVSPIAETESDVDEATSSKELVVWKAPGSRKLARSLSNQDYLGANESSSDIRDFAVSSSFVATKRVSAEEMKPHSRSSSSSEDPSNVASNTHSRSSSLSDPFSDTEFQGNLVAQAGAKPKEFAASAVVHPIESPVEKHVKHLVRACASMSLQIDTTSDTHAFRKGWSKAGEMRWVKAPSVSEVAKPVEQSANETRATGIEGDRNSMQAVHVGDDSATTANTPPSKAAESKSLSVCHYPVADIPPTQHQKPVAMEAGDVVEVENGDGIHMKWLEAEMIGPLIGLAVVGLACKVIKKVIWKTPW